MAYFMSVAEGSVMEYVLQAVETHPDIDEAAQGMKEAVKDLGHTLEEATSESGVVSGLIDSIGKALAGVRYPYHT